MKFTAAIAVFLAASASAMPAAKLPTPNNGVVRRVDNTTATPAFKAFNPPVFKPKRRSTRSFTNGLTGPSYNGTQPGAPRPSFVVPPPGSVGRAI